MKVVSSTGDEVYFKIKRSTKLSKLQGAYATKVGKDVNSIRYVSFFRALGRFFGCGPGLRPLFFNFSLTV